MGDPAGLEVPPARLPSTLVEARHALEGDQVLRSAMGELLHGSLLDSFAGEINRVEDLPPEQQVASTCWWPIVGGLFSDSSTRNHSNRG